MSLSSVLIKGLEARYLSVLHECERLSKISPKDGIYKNLYQEVSFFLHYIVKNKELEIILIDLLSYYQNLKKRQEYSAIAEKMTEAVQAAANGLLKHSNYTNFIQNDSANYVNPYLNPPLCSPDVALNMLKDFNFNHNVSMFPIMERVLGVLGSMVQKWIRVDATGFEEVIKNIHVLHEEQQKLNDLENFEYDYIGARSAEELFTIYKAFKPHLRKNWGAYESLIWDIVEKGKPLGDDPLTEIQVNCRKVFEYIQTNLSARLEIEVAIDRFAVYTALYSDYKITSSKVEKFLQGKFEEFLFQSGYYPISEASLKNARIDTLAVNENNSFLCEYKQLNLGKTQLKKADFDKKMRGVRIQSNIYSDRLRLYPNFNRTVFLIIFTNQRIDFKNNIDRVSVNGINFVIKIIYLSGKTPSTVKITYSLDVEKIIA